MRYLHFGSEWIQGAMRIARPWSLELAYTREMMLGLLLHDFRQWPRRVLLIGLGAASLVRFIYRHLPCCSMLVAEIHSGVVAAARQFFKLPDDPERLEIMIADGADAIIQDIGDFDLILVDGFDALARCGKLDSASFYANCHLRLSADGLLVCNMLGHNRGFATRLARLRSTFDGRVLSMPSSDHGNVVAIASRNRISASMNELRERAGMLKKVTGLDLAPTLSRLQMAHPLPNNSLCL